MSVKQQPLWHQLNVIHAAVSFIPLDSCQGDSPNFTISLTVSVLVTVALVGVGADNISRPDLERNIESPPASSRSLMESDPVRMHP